MSKHYLISAIIAAVICIFTLPVYAAEMPKQLSLIIKNREAILGNLTEQIEYCVNRTDTRHIYFHGCIDWHSSVHGNWSLLAAARADVTTKFSQKFDQLKISSDSLKAEIALLKSNPRFERPYGRAWFLRLIIEQNAQDNSDALLELSLGVFDELLSYIARSGRGPYSKSYNSESWALINLYDYADHFLLKERREKVKQVVLTKYFRANTADCNYASERGSFMAICTNWAMLARRVMDTHTFDSWADNFIKRNGLPTPITRPRSAHEFGLNFSRAWGLWDLMNASSVYRPEVAKAYASHFITGYTPATNWSGNYYQVGHWVAQFGVFALQPLIGGRVK